MIQYSKYGPESQWNSLYPYLHLVEVGCGMSAHGTQQARVQLQI